MSTIAYLSKKLIQTLEAKIARAVEILKKLKILLSKSAMFNLYYSLTDSHLVYGITVWVNIFPSYIKRLQILQNKAIRIVTGSSWNENNNPVY